MASALCVCVSLCMSKLEQEQRGGVVKAGTFCSEGAGGLEGAGGAWRGLGLPCERASSESLLLLMRSSALKPCLIQRSKLWLVPSRAPMSLSLCSTVCMHTQQACVQPLDDCVACFTSTCLSVSCQDVQVDAHRSLNCVKRKGI